MGSEIAAGSWIERLMGTQPSDIVDFANRQLSYLSLSTQLVLMGCQERTVLLDHEFFTVLIYNMNVPLFGFSATLGINNNTNDHPKCLILPAFDQFSTCNHTCMATSPL